MVVSKVPLCRRVKLVLVVARELRPALAEGDSPVPSVDLGHVAMVVAVWRHLVRPAERVAACYLGFHQGLTMQL
jgi:hypothetical protein